MPASIKGIISNDGKRLWGVNRLKGCATGESLILNLRERLGQAYGLDSRVVTESPFPDLGDGVGYSVILRPRRKSYVSLHHRRRGDRCQADIGHLGHDNFEVVLYSTYVLVETVPSVQFGTGRHGCGKRETEGQ